MEAASGQRALLRQVSAALPAPLPSRLPRALLSVTPPLPQVLGWRLAAAVAWSVLLLPVCTAAFVLLSGVRPLCPLRWLSDSFSDLYTSHVIFCMLLMSVVILVISVFNAEFYAGYIPKMWISTTMDLHIDSKLHPLDTLSGLLDLSLFYHAWLSGVFLLVTWYIAWLFFKIYATEMHHFPVQPTFAEETDQCLPKILNSNPPLIIKFLALQDLMLLSQYSPVRRQEVFSLSQPGGHPHNWTAISRECLSLLTDLTQRLIAQQEAAAANGRAKQQVGEVKASLQTPGAAVAEDMPFQLQRSNVIPRAAMSSLVKSSVMPLKASPGSAVGSPFSSPALNGKVGVLDLSSPWHGSVQSPHVVQRGPKLWQSGSGQHVNGSHHESFPVPSVARAGSEAVQPSFIYTWFQNKQEQVEQKLQHI
ncbi:hypothetical protein ASZ78_016032 [Callipepla squamata]|uniref:Nucleoporin NDC1 n=1 Tax=Callipepla squamata TaxID=9009 RepID=A0A226NBI2_CALSU|nr:hypothetical protein ASZ78_016032 [Callipepla squamata]